MSGEDHQSFVATLESFRELKSGISGSRIKKLTTYALEHIEDEETIISSIINYSKTCSDSHKLGSLYIIDSIGRAYLDEARANDDYIKPTARKGTCAHAVYTLGESIQELLTSAIAKSNEDHKEKIRTLIDIWDRAGLFQKGYLNAIRAKCFSMDVIGEDSQSSTSGSSFSKGKQLSDNPKERCIQILNDLRPLKFIPAVDLPLKLSSTDLSEQQAALFQVLVNIQQQFHQQQHPQQQLQEQQQQQQQQQQQLLLQQQQQQQQQHNQQHQQQQHNQQQYVQAQSSVSGSSTRHGHVTTEYGSRRERERERERYSSRRNRSRSPPRRDSHHGSSGHLHSNSNGPLGTNNHHLYPDEQNVPSNPHFRSKPVSFESSLPPDQIKVYSRTLFVGGVPMNMKEWDIANVLRPYAEVQSVILNNARKHAFVKVYSRTEAENVLMNFNKDGSSPLRTRWGVGFGPRDCCNYQHGYSIIPLHRLTDADKKWCVHAQWGGTGGQPLQGGVVFEEPDIIVGEGVSSKAISQKMPTDSGRNGPRSGKANKGSASTPPLPTYGTNQIPSPGQMYGQIQPPFPQQQAPFGQAQVAPQIAGYPQPPPQQQSFDATAQLNSLMSMLNQQQN